MLLLLTEYPSTNFHMKRFASFFKGCRFKNTIVDGYSDIAPNNDDIDNEINKNKDNKSNNDGS